MNTRKFLILGLIVILAWLVPIGGAEQSSSAQTSPSGLESAISPDGGYWNPDITWKVDGVTSGGAYRLDSSRLPASTGSGCCCTYLPCILLQR
jgi:hypothetical protein